MEAIVVSVPAQLNFLCVFRAGVASLASVYQAYERRPSARCLYAWALAVYEAATNVVRHGYDGRGDEPLTLTIEPGEDRVVFLLTDCGRYNHAWWQEAAAPGGAEGGYGLQLIRTLMDEASYVRDARGCNVLRLVGRLDSCRVDVSLT